MTSFNRWNMKNVIIVDDETDMFPLFNIKFKKEIKGHLVKFFYFSSARDALSLLKGSESGEFNLVISDIIMPEMTGLELLEEIKSQNDKQKVYIISGHGSKENIDEALDLGADGFLEKPINFPHLKKVVLG